jgi:hypothetical protein
LINSTNVVNTTIEKHGAKSFLNFNCLTGIDLPRTVFAEGLRTATPEPDEKAVEVKSTR